MIGFDATEDHRTYGDQDADPRYELRYPLRQWGWDRRTCQQVIADAGLPVPVKSACFFCPASKRHEVIELARDEPQLYQLAIAVEQNYRQGKHYQGETATCQGLGGRSSWAAQAQQRQLF